MEDSRPEKVLETMGRYDVTILTLGHMPHGLLESPRWQFLIAFSSHIILALSAVLDSILCALVSDFDR